MAIQVLGISGSPHRHGNTETLLDRFLSGAQDAGAGIEKVILRDLTYTPCRGCNVCHRTGECVVNDDLQALFGKILEADVLAIASPIYTMSITAETKALIDRAQAFWAQKYILKTRYYSHEQIRRHKGIFISTAGLGWENVFNTAFPVITAFFDILGFEYYDNIIANNMDKYGGIAGHPTALNQAYEKGQEVVRVIERMKKD